MKITMLRVIAVIGITLSLIFIIMDNCHAQNLKKIIGSDDRYLTNHLSIGRVESGTVIVLQSGVFITIADVGIYPGLEIEFDLQKSGGEWIPNIIIEVSDDDITYFHIGNYTIQFFNYEVLLPQLNGLTFMRIGEYSGGDLVTVCGYGEMAGERPQSASTDEIIEIFENQSKIRYKCDTNSGSTGSAIIESDSTENLASPTNDYLIGLHDEDIADIYENYNEGIFFGEYLSLLAFSEKLDEHLRYNDSGEIFYVDPGHRNSSSNVHNENTGKIFQPFKTARDMEDVVFIVSDRIFAMVYFAPGTYKQTTEWIPYGTRTVIPSSPFGGVTIIPPSIGDPFEKINLRRTRDMIRDKVKPKIWANPNPFNSSTLISYEINFSQPVTIGIYNTTGQIIRKETKHADVGLNYYRFNPNQSLASGIYIIQIETLDWIQSKKVSYVK